MIRLVIPMAGAGSRFVKAGYELPKPLIDVAGKPMIERVIENLNSERTQIQPIFIIQKSHNKKYNLKDYLLLISPDSQIIEIDGLTDGAARTVLSAEFALNPDDEVIIANSDQWVDTDFENFIDYARNFDGAILTMTADDPKWSYVSFDESKKITSVVEKIVVSEEATVGIYYFRRWSDFVSGAKMMIRNKNTSAGEYYVAPVYNNLISQGKNIGLFNIGSERNGMYGLGTPEDLDWFLKNKQQLLT